MNPTYKPETRFFVDAQRYGFTPGNSPERNDLALSLILDRIPSGAGAGAAIVIPPGVYDYSGIDLSYTTDHWNKTLRFIGSGVGTTVLNNTHATNHGIKVHGSGINYPQWLGFEGMTLIGNGQAVGQHGVSLDRCRHIYFRDMEIRNYDHGVHNRLAWGLSFSFVNLGSEVTTANNVGFYNEDSGNVSPVPNSFIDCKFNQNSQYGIDVANGANVFGFINCEIEANKLAGARLNGSATRAVGFHSCTFEGNGVQNYFGPGTIGDPYLINGPDVLIGQSGSPTGIMFSTCRFFRKTGYATGNNVAVRILAGGRFTFIGNNYVNYTNADGGYTGNCAIEFVETDAGSPGSLTAINPTISNTTQAMIVGRDTTGNPGERVSIATSHYFSGSSRQYMLQNGEAWSVSGNQVFSTRKTGWSAATGTPTRTSFATSSVTTAQLAERVKALLDDLISHGLIGA